MLTDEEKSKLKNRLRRVSGQVAAVERMVDEGAYCIDTLTQIAAATGALGKVGQLVLESHIRSCVAEAASSDNPAERDEKLEELIRLFRKYASLSD
ncbi:metal-sensitive transcriptional regulator [Botrimarina sp.]|uniref:metal-sensitive transcriptional regulator n=1 Tax=Botrimarina sp. TaxID=2795802 RepID=UPI0032EDC3E6